MIEHYLGEDTTDTDTDISSDESDTLSAKNRKLKADFIELLQPVLDSMPITAVGEFGEAANALKSIKINRGIVTRAYLVRGKFQKTVDDICDLLDPAMGYFYPSDAALFRATISQSLQRKIAQLEGSSGQERQSYIEELYDRYPRIFDVPPPSPLPSPSLPSPSPLPSLSPSLPSSLSLPTCQPRARNWDWLWFPTIKIANMTAIATGTTTAVFTPVVMPSYVWWKMMPAKLNRLMIGIAAVSTCSLLMKSSSEDRQRLYAMFKDLIIDNAVYFYVMGHAIINECGEEIGKVIADAVRHSDTDRSHAQTPQIPFWRNPDVMYRLKSDFIHSLRISSTIPLSLGVIVFSELHGLIQYMFHKNAAPSSSGSTYGPRV